MPDLLITLLEYLGWTVFFLFILFGVLGVAAFLGLKRFEPEEHDGMVEESELRIADRADEGYGGTARRAGPVKVPSGE